MPHVSHSSGPIVIPGVSNIDIRMVGDGKAIRGIPQMLLVKIPPYESIAPHSHEVDAEMIIVRGSGRVRSRDAMNGRRVGPGDHVYFEKNALHGFDADEEGLDFLSVNGGIADHHGTADIQFAA